MNYNKHVVGTTSELLAKVHFLNKGYIVSKPINDFNRYDLIIDNGEKIERVQVKTAYWDNNKKRYLVSCVVTHIRGDENRYNKKYEEGSFDLLACVHPESNSIYVIPFEEVEGRRSLTLYPDGKPKAVNSRYRDFEDYKEKLTMLGANPSPYLQSGYL